MAIFEVKADSIQQVSETTFGAVGIRERTDLQRLLRENIEVISPDTLVLAEEFGDWSDSRRRIDLLGLDRDANLVVIELKRTEDGGFMELQAIRYAAMVSTMTFDKAVNIYTTHLRNHGKDGDAAEAILSFLEWEQPDDDRFAQDVRIVLASAEFSKELTTTVMWLNEHDLDVRCVRMKPYCFENRLLIDVQQIVPLPEATDYQVQLKEKARKERAAREYGIDFTRFDLTIRGQTHQGLWKRNAIALLCRELCSNGIQPEQIAELLHWRPTTVWRVVDGNVDAADFLKLASQAYSNCKKSRWFCTDSELLHLNNRTYALSNQWGGDSWHRAMKALTESFAEFGIEYSPTE